MDFFQQLFAGTDVVINAYILGTVNKIMMAVGPTAVTLFGIYVIVWALAHLYNRIDEPVTDAAKRMIMIAIILGLALNAGYYTAYVVSFVRDTPPYLATLMVNTGPGSALPAGNSASTASLLDSMMDKGFQLGAIAWTKGGVLSGDFGMYLVSAICYLATAVLVLFAAVMLMLATVGMAVLLVIGPIFIMLLMFESTKRFFALWLGQIVNFMLTYVLSVAVISLIFKFVSNFLDSAIAQSPNNTSMSSAAQLVIMAGIGTLILRQVPGISSAISGGIGLSTLGGFGATMRGGGRAARGTGGLAGKAGRGAAQRAWRNRQFTAGRAAVANAFRRTNALSRR